MRSKWYYVVTFEWRRDPSESACGSDDREMREVVVACDGSSGEEACPVRKKGRGSARIVIPCGDSE